MLSADTQRILGTLAQVLTTPLEEARALPAAAYLSEELYALEIERIFRREWICLGREEEFEKPGDYTCMELAGEPLIILRDQNGRLRALSNVCRHRYMQILKDRGHAARLVCPYHGWAYTLDGGLIGAPHMTGNRVFDKRACRLPEFPLETWLGFVFVNLDRDAQPLAPRLQSLGERLQHYGIREMRNSALYDNIWEGNWKLTMENNAEAYHHGTLHSDTLQPWMPGERSYCGESSDYWSLLRSPLDMERLRQDAPRYAELIDRWGANVPLEDRFETLTYVMYPCGSIDVSPGLVFWKRILPLDSTRTRVLMGALVPASEHCAELTRENSTFYEILNPEDSQATWKLQRTVASRFTEPGPLSDKEACLHHFHQYLARQLCHVH